MRDATLNRAVPTGLVTTGLQERQRGTDVHLIGLWSGQAAVRHWLIRMGPVTDADVIDLANNAIYDCHAMAATGRSTRDIAVARDRADELAERHWGAIERVAALLLSAERLTGDQIAEHVGVRSWDPAVSAVTSRMEAQ